MVSRDLQPGPVTELGSLLPVAAIFDGVDYVVAFLRTKGAWAWSGSLVLGRVSRDGELLFLRDVVLDPVTNVNYQNLSMATNGPDFVLAWNDFIPTECGLTPCVTPERLRVLTFNGALEVTSVRGTTLISGGMQPSVIWTGSAFVITWTDMLRVYAQTVDPNVPITVDPRVVFDHPGGLVMQHAAAWNGEHIAVAVGTGSSDGRVYMTRVDRNGTPLDAPAGIPLLHPWWVSSLNHTAGPDREALLTIVGALPHQGTFATVVRHEQISRRRAATR